MASLSLSPSMEKPLTPSCFYTGHSPTSFEVGRCRGCHAGRAVWPGEAEILSASIKPLPALAALSTKKKKANKNKPAFVSHLLFSLLVSSMCVRGNSFQGLTGCCCTRSPEQGLQPQPSKPSSQPSKPSSGAFLSWSLLQGACHHLSHLPKEKGCPICPEPIHLEEFVSQSADGVSRFALK